MEAIFEKRLEHRATQDCLAWGALGFGLDGVAAGLDPAWALLDRNRSLKRGSNAAGFPVRLADEIRDGDAIQGQPVGRASDSGTATAAREFTGLDGDHVEFRRDGCGRGLDGGQRD